MNDQDLHTITHLLLHHLQGVLTPEEADQLAIWRQADPANQALLDRMDSPEQLQTELIRYQEVSANLDGQFIRHFPAFARILPDTVVENRPVRRLSWLAAASIAALLCLGGYWTLTRLSTRRHQRVITAPALAQDVLPGGSKAILTLSDGRQIILDSAHQGELAMQGGTAVRKTENGKLTYQVMGHNANSTTTYNTLSTPRGGQYQLTLPDGTRVWLNAASSITYPIAFAGDARKVTITGEAYFEVAHKASQPFSITGNDMTIEVLGTSFNINAYLDEPLARTTLVEGSIQIKANGIQQLIRPGEQAAITPGGKGFAILPHADVGQAIAWKNGLFSFVNADLPMVMRQLARWYDVEIVYEGHTSKRSFNGEIGKNLTLDQVLKILTQSRVHYTIEGKVLTIKPS